MDTTKMFSYRTLRNLAHTTLLLAWVLPTAGQEGAPAEEEPLWKNKLGLSFLATGGNTDTSSLGLDLLAVRRATPWGWELKALADRAEEDGEATAERFFAGARATRALDARPELFLGVSFEQDEFAGIDLRALVEAGVILNVKETEEQSLRFDLGLTWTDEDRTEPEPDSSDLGAILGLRYERKISETADFSQVLTFFPNFGESDDWRAESLTALTVAVSERLAVQLGYEVRYRNQPIGDRDDTDTSAKASVLWKF